MYMYILFKFKSVFNEIFSLFLFFYFLYQPANIHWHSNSHGEWEMMETRYKNGGGNRRQISK